MIDEEMSIASFGVAESVSECAFIRALEPLGHTAPLVCATRVPLLGIPVEIRSNSATVIAAAEAALGHWHQLDPKCIESRPSLGLDVIVHTSGLGFDPVTSQFITRLHDDCFLAASGENVLTARRRDGKALAFVSPGLVASPIRFRREVLECLALLLVSYHDRAPVHAGAVVRHDRAVLLVGRGGAGKSTLSYACIRRGLRLLAEDCVYVSRERGLRVWGNPTGIQLRPDVLCFFPELNGVAPEDQGSGKYKIIVDVGRSNPATVSFQASPVAVCLLERSESDVSMLETADPAAIVSALSRDLEPGFDVSSQALEVAQSLATCDVYRLRVGSDLDRAVTLVESLTLQTDD